MGRPHQTPQRLGTDGLFGDGDLRIQRHRIRIWFGRVDSASATDLLSARVRLRLAARRNRRSGKQSICVLSYPVWPCRSANTHTELQPEASSRSSFTLAWLSACRTPGQVGRVKADFGPRASSTALLLSQKPRSRTRAAASIRHHTRADDRVCRATANLFNFRAQKAVGREDWAAPSSWWRRSPPRLPLYSDAGACATIQKLDNCL